MVSNVIREYPQSTVRRNGSGLSKSSFYRILKFELKMKPYKMQIKHQLLPADFDRRLAFSFYFYLWGHLKNQVYKTAPASLQILRERIENMFMEIKDNPQESCAGSETSGQ